MIAEFTSKDDYLDSLCCVCSLHFWQNFFISSLVIGWIFDLDDT
jgi:hypothetical protein